MTWKPAAAEVARGFEVHVPARTCSLLHISAGEGRKERGEVETVAADSEWICGFVGATRGGSETRYLVFYRGAGR